MCDLSNFFLTRANILSTCQWRGRVYKVFMTWSWYSALNWLPIYWKGFKVLGIVGPARHSLLEFPGTTVWFLFAGYCASLLSGLPSCLWFLWCPKGLQWQLRASWPYKYVFPVPFLHIYTYSRSVAFPALTPTPSCCHFIFGWCWGKIIKCAWLNRSHGTGPFGGHLLRGCQCLLRHQLLSCSDSFVLCNPWMQFTERILFCSH